MRFFASMRLTAASLAISIAFFGLIGIYFLLTQYLQFVQATGPVRRRAAHAALRRCRAGDRAARRPGSWQRFGTKAVVTAGDG